MDYDGLIGVDIRGVQLRPVSAYDIPEKYAEGLEGVLITNGDLRDRASRMSADINRMCTSDGMHDLLAICMIKGAARFYDELINEGRLECSVQGISVDKQIS
jgi:hypoxanthine-guanine phosphoribosyltransferase